MSVTATIDESGALDFAPRRACRVAVAERGWWHGPKRRHCADSRRFRLAVRRRNAYLPGQFACRLRDRNEDRLFPEVLR
jgi:hypothetical protein